MTIPRIEAYPTPGSSELPQSKVSWSVEPERAALLIHDMQDYFLDFYDRSAQPIIDVLANIERLRATCRKLGIPVIYTAQPPEQTAAQRGLLTDMWGPGITSRPEAHTIVEALRPADDDIVITKYRYSAFFETDLSAILRARGRDQLFVCGVYAHIGCMLSACDAFMHGVKPFFVADAVADFTPAHHQQAVAYVADHCGVSLLTEQLLAPLEHALRSSGAPTFEGLRREVAALLELDEAEVGSADSLMDLGMDSIRLMSLVESLRARGVGLTFVEVAECSTLGDVFALVAASKPSESAVSA